MAEMKTCSGCPFPGKCRGAGKCLKQKKDAKTMGKSKPSYGNK